MFGESKKGCRDVVGMFGKPKRAAELWLGCLVSRKRAEELWLGASVGRKRAAEMVLGCSPCHFGIKQREETPFWRHLSLIFGPWAGVTPRSGLRA